MERKTPEIVVVTGASAGIGRATVREFARHGAHLGLIARGTDGLEAAQREVEETGRPRHRRPDRRRRRRSGRSAPPQRIEDELGPIDIWVNNAFAGIFSPFKDMTPEEFKRVTAGHVSRPGQRHAGGAEAHAAARPRARSCRSARRWPIAASRCNRPIAAPSTPSRASSIRCAASCCTTAANVTITMVQLPGVNTPQFDWVRAKLPGRPQPVGTVYQPEVAARAIHFAAHSAARSCSSARRRCRRSGATSSRPARSIIISARPGSRASRIPSRSARTARTICSRRCPATMARAAASTTRRWRTSAELWLSNTQEAARPRRPRRRRGGGCRLHARGAGHARRSRCEACPRPARAFAPAAAGGGPVRPRRRRRRGIALARLSGRRRTGRRRPRRVLPPARRCLRSRSRSTAVSNIIGRASATGRCSPRRPCRR